MKKSAAIFSVLVMSIVVLCLSSCKSHERCPAYGGNAEAVVKHNRV